jgi:hypothetical protein
MKEHFCFDDDDLEAQILSLTQTAASDEMACDRMLDLVDVEESVTFSRSSPDDERIGMSVSVSRSVARGQLIGGENRVVVDEPALYANKNKKLSLSVYDDAASCATPIARNDRAKLPNYVVIPSNSALGKDHHVVPNECAICLDRFRPNQVLTVSPFVICTHAFHSDCISTWCLQQLKTSQMRAASSYLSDSPRDTERNTANCPCCRQTFVVVKAQRRNS